MTPVEKATFETIQAAGFNVERYVLHGTHHARGKHPDTEEHMVGTGDTEEDAIVDLAVGLGFEMEE